MLMNRFQFHQGLTLSEFLAIYLISQTRIGLSALILKRHPGVNYSIAWLVQRKLKSALFRCKAAFKIPAPDFVQPKSPDSHG